MVVVGSWVVHCHSPVIVYIRNKIIEIKIKTTPSGVVLIVVPVRPVVVVCHCCMLLLLLYAIVIIIIVVVVDAVVVVGDMAMVM